MFLDLPLAPGGFTGFTQTPSATVLQAGTLGVGYGNSVAGSKDPRGHSFVVGLGLDTGSVGGLEVVGRVAANDLNCRMFSGECPPNRGGLRDLSAGAKFATQPFGENLPSFAIGVTDFGGAATNFRQTYGVVSQDLGTFTASLGAARAQSPSSPIDGPFGSVSWRPTNWFQAFVEHDSRAPFLGLRWISTERWLPSGWQTHATVTTRFASREQPGVPDQRTTFSFGLQVPLDFSGANPRLGIVPQPPPAVANTANYAPTALPTAHSILPEKSVAPDVTRERTTKERLASKIARSALQNGLRSIWVGFNSPTRDVSSGIVTLRFDAGDWAWSDIDAIGAALGVLARAEVGDRPYRVILTKFGLPVIALEGETRCLVQAISTSPNFSNVQRNDCPDRLFRSSTRRVAELQRDVEWVVEDSASLLRNPRFSLFPSIVATTATEYGLYDASTAASTKLELPLWTGGAIEVRHDTLVARSQDFDPGSIYGPYRLRSGVARAMFHQYQPLSDTVWGRVGVGRVNRDFDGGDAELRWAPGDGRHRGILRLGQFVKPANLDSPQLKAQPRLASWRWSAVPGKWDLEGTAGEFFNRDRGWQMLTKHWFGDTLFGFYLRKTKKPDEPSYSMAGVLFEFPLTPQRDFRVGDVALRGTPRFGYGVETVVGGDTNPVLFGYGVFLPNGMGLNDVIFDRDRLEPINLERQRARLLIAARKVIAITE